MLLKLLVILAVAHQITGCCLPDTYQFTMFSETSFGGERFRSRTVMAFDAAQGKAALFMYPEAGYATMFYVNFNTGRVHMNAPSYGCYEMPLDGSISGRFNESRCIPREVLSQRSIHLTLAEGLNASLFSGNMPTPGGNSTGNSTGNATMSFSALVSDRCRPILVKVGGPQFDNTNIFADFLPGPQPGLLDLPAACRSGNGTAGHRKRAVALGYGRSPLLF